MIWPYSVSMLVKWVAFLSTLQWPQDGADLGVGGVSYVELLILHEIWACERLELEKAVPRYRRPGRSISVSAVPFGPGTDLWRSCRSFGALFDALVGLPRGIRWLVSCDLGANHCRLRHLGWEKCGHGLTPGLVSRPRKVFLMSSAAASLGGELPLRYCSGRFACRVPTWGLPSRGHVQGRVAEFAEVGGVPRSSHVARAQLPGLVGDAGVLVGRRILGCVERVRLHRKTPAHLAGAGMGVLSLVQGSGRD